MNKVLLHRQSKHRIRDHPASLPHPLMEQNTCVVKGVALRSRVIHHKNMSVKGGIVFSEMFENATIFTDNF